MAGRGMCGLLSVTVVAAGTGMAQGAGAPPWRIVQLIGPSTGGLTEMTGIAAIDSSHAWAVALHLRHTAQANWA